MLSSTFSYNSHSLFVSIVCWCQNGLLIGICHHITSLCCLFFSQDLAKQESSVAHLNLTDDKANDAPNSGSEVLKGIGSVRTDFSVALSPRKVQMIEESFSFLPILVSSGHAKGENHFLLAFRHPSFFTAQCCWILTLHFKS